MIQTNNAMEKQRKLPAVHATHSLTNTNERHVKDQEVEFSTGKNETLPPDGMTYNLLWGNKIHITFTNDTNISEKTRTKFHVMH